MEFSHGLGRFCESGKAKMRHVYRRVKKLILVEDNLNTHNKETLIKRLGETEGKSIARRSSGIIRQNMRAGWLDQAEIERHALETQCLNRRIPDIWPTQSEVAACVRKRNEDKCGINWKFTKVKAGIKFRRV